MKQVLIIAFFLISLSAQADDAKNEWHNTSLSDATIKKIQESQYHYKKCIANELQVASARQQDVRKGTEAIVKKCENVLADMRNVYLEEKVPEVIADRHLKQMRIQTTRDVLREMMFIESARKAGQQ